MTSFDPLLRRLVQENPIRVTRNDLQWYPAQIESLRQEGLIEETTPFTRLQCPECSGPGSLEVGREGGIPFVVCHECGLVRVTDDDLRCWVLRISTLLAWLRKALKIEGDIQTVVEDVLWKAGVLSCEGVTHPCFFLRQDDLSDGAVAKSLSGSQNAVVFYLGPEIFEAQPFHIVSFSMSLSVHAGKIVLPPVQELLSGGRAVRLLPDGVVLVGQSKVGLIPPATVHFWFFEQLHEHIGNVVSYEAMYSHVLSKDGKIASGVSKNAPGYCQNLKNELKKKKYILDAIVNEIIETGKTPDGKKGYSMKRTATLPENPLRA